MNNPGVVNLSAVAAQADLLVMISDKGKRTLQT